MYSTCLHCTRPLGRNDALEAMPIGRRVAFDAAKGRVWVVCRVCERWNLTPFESRWEAIEQAERLFRDTRVRVSTDQIGLARVAEGTTLIRIGAPSRPEFAAWRYGDQFGKRRRRAMLYTAAGVAGVGAVVSSAWAAGVGMVTLVPIFNALNMATLLHANQRGLKRFAHPTLETFVPLGTPRLVTASTEEGWAIEVAYQHGGPDPRRQPIRSLKDVLRRVPHNTDIRFTVLAPRDALSYMRWVLPKVNRGGAPKSVVQDGVQLIADAGGSAGYGRWAAGQRRVWAARQTWGDTGDLRAIPHAARLAFEMALHEDSERAAMEGELAVLEQAWEEAERVAAIADGLLIPPHVDARFEAMTAAARDRGPAD